LPTTNRNGLNFGVLDAAISRTAQSLVEHTKLLEAHSYDCFWIPVDRADLLYDITTQIKHLKFGVCCNARDGDAMSMAETILGLHKKAPGRIHVGLNATGDQSQITTVIEKLKAILPPTITLSALSQASPAGAQLAGVNKLGLMSIAATTPGGFNALSPSWDIYQRNCGDISANRNTWALAGPVHIAATRKTAYQQVEQGLPRWIEHLRETQQVNLVSKGGDPVKSLVTNGIAVIGTPTDAIKQIRRLRKASGGFGCFLQTVHGWADEQATIRSYELFAQRVIPLFR
jgi:hypothetical protein